MKDLENIFREIVPAGVDFCSLRHVCSDGRSLMVRQDVPEAPGLSHDEGAMITVIAGGGIGYGATCDLSREGLKNAAQQAADWARHTAGRCVTNFSKLIPAAVTGEYRTPEETPWASLSLAALLDVLTEQSRRLKTAECIVDWMTAVRHWNWQTLLLTTAGTRVRQSFSSAAVFMSVSANRGSDTQTRTLGGHGYSQQGGAEVLTRCNFTGAAPRLAGEAIELLDAPNCPKGSMDLLIDSDQMVLQVHESIGHPLELDRILGDERNYAGTSFVTLDMIGTYRYGSDLLNVFYDPTCAFANASFGWDDDGAPARKTAIIEKGILKGVQGGAFSQARAGRDSGTASSRACNWNRPPIDRMANLNVECGQASLEAMIAAVKRGVYMKTNRSWSIDDSRNKFQFGCEWARLIEDGRLTTVVKNPNYRGISATFWRNLKMVGSAATMETLGTPNCGKGEPNQCVGTGHASPACLFTDVEVFGGA
ncbi:MAG: TldD/PmbA family protein [Phycisphaerae bacterium]